MNRVAAISFMRHGRITVCDGIQKVFAAFDIDDGVIRYRRNGDFFFGCAGNQAADEKEKDQSAGQYAYRFKGISIKRKDTYAKQYAPYHDARYKDRLHDYVF